MQKQPKSWMAIKLLIIFEKPCYKLPQKSSKSVESNYLSTYYIYKYLNKIYRIFNIYTYIYIIYIYIYIILSYPYIYTYITKVYINCSVYGIEYFT